MHIDAEILQHALVGYEAQLATINKRVAEIRSSLGRQPDKLSNAKPRKKFSAATIAKMRASQQARRHTWRVVGTAKGMHATPAKTHASVKQMSASQKKRWAEGSYTTKRHPMTAAGRKAVSLAMKKRWRAAKAKGKNRLAA